MVRLERCPGCELLEGSADDLPSDASRHGLKAALYLFDQAPPDRNEEET